MKLALAASALLGLFFVACSGDDSTGGATSAAGGGATKVATSAGGATKRTDTDDLKVTAKEFAFTLSLTKVRPGPPGVNVILTNAGAAPHQLVFYQDADYKKAVSPADSGRAAAGQTAAFPFIPPDGVQKLYYRCEIHPAQMKGELAVGP